MPKGEIVMVACVEAKDFPPEVEEWCMDNDISTHYQNDLIQVEDDGNAFAKWLKTQGLNLDEQHHFNTYGGAKGFFYVGIFAT